MFRFLQAEKKDKYLSAKDSIFSGKAIRFYGKPMSLVTIYASPLVGITLFNSFEILSQIYALHQSLDR